MAHKDFEKIRAQARYFWNYYANQGKPRDRNYQSNNPLGLASDVCYFRKYIYTPDAGYVPKELRQATDAALRLKQQRPELPAVPLAENPQWPTEQDFIKLEQWFESCAKALHTRRYCRPEEGFPRARAIVEEGRYKGIRPLAREVGCSRKTAERYVAEMRKDPRLRREIDNPHPERKRLKDLPGDYNPAGARRELTDTEVEEILYTSLELIRAEYGQDKYTETKKDFDSRTPEGRRELARTLEEGHYDDPNRNRFDPDASQVQYKGLRG